MYWLDPTSLTYKVLRVIIFGFMSTYFIPITATDKMGAQKSFSFIFGTPYKFGDTLTQMRLHRPMGTKRNMFGHYHVF